jgi:hypothetical protein
MLILLCAAKTNASGIDAAMEVTIELTDKHYQELKLRKKQRSLCVLQ